MPDPGSFFLYSEVRPPITAGDYRWKMTEPATAGDTAGPVAAHEPYLRVTSPRFTMPPDQLLSTFPPANAEGAFGARLPQVVLKRRTLPWERAPAASGADARAPWLALVVFAAGEAELSTETDVADCVTSGVNLTGPHDVPRGLYVEVTQTVLDKVFPTKEDLPLLTHVREVDKSDTELALGDDDGWMAVVLANRFPQPTVTMVDGVPVTNPVRYLAALVSLEGQIDVLPEEPLVDDIFVAVDTIRDYEMSYRTAYGETPQPDSYTMSSSIMGSIRDVVPHSKGRRRRPEPKARQIDDARHGTARGVTGAEPMAATWQDVQQEVEQASVGDNAYVAVRDVMGKDWRFPIDLATQERRYRFPCLAHWSFTTTDGASFEELMLGLDVGLLGSLPAEPELPDGAPLPPPRTRPQPEVAETGHVGLSHLARRGDRTSAWYRGPLSPHVTERDEPAQDGALPIAHASDQLRRVTPDGREDLTYAAAFEIGRLLALSQPSVVSGLMRWRAEQYGAERSRQVAEEGFGALVDIGGTKRVDLGRLLGGVLVDQFVANPDGILGPRRPLVDPGRAIPGLADAELETVVAGGLGLDLDRVREMAERVGAAAALAHQVVPVVEQDISSPLTEGRDLDALRAAAESSAARMAEQATSGRDDKLRPRSTSRRRKRAESDEPPPRRRRDALDRAIRSLEEEQK